MKKNHIVSEIMDQSRHQFIYGYHGEDRTNFLRGLEEKYPIVTDQNIPMAIYLNEIGLPKQTIPKEADRSLIDSVCREFLTTEIVYEIVDRTSKSKTDDEFKKRLQKLLTRTNMYIKSADYKDIESLEELKEALKQTREFYERYYYEYIKDGKRRDIREAILPFIQLELWVTSFKRVLNNDSYFGIICEKKDELSLFSTRNINFLVGGRINKDISMKVAVEPDKWDTYTDPNGQFIEAIHDYGTVELDDSLKVYMKRMIDKK